MNIPMLGGGDGPKSFQQEYDAYCKLSKKNVSDRSLPLRQLATAHTHSPLPSRTLSLNTCQHSPPHPSHPLSLTQWYLLSSPFGVCAYQRMRGFLGCFAAGWILSACSLFTIPGLALGRPAPFAILYTVGNILALSSRSSYGVPSRSSRACSNPSVLVPLSSTW